MISQGEDGQKHRIGELREGTALHHAFNDEADIMSGGFNAMMTEHEAQALERRRSIWRRDQI